MDFDVIPPIFMNDDCLLTLFKYLDLESLMNLSEVCQKFNDLIEKYFFSKVKKINNIQEEVVSIDKWRKCLRCVGRYIEELRYNELDNEIIHDSNLSQSYFEAIERYVGGKNVQHARLDVALDTDKIAAIKPLLQHLISLTIHDDNDSDSNFEELCPNLTKLRISSCNTFPKCTKQWPNLKYLHAFAQRDLITIPDANRYLDFFENNPQVTCLMICAHYPDVIFPAMVKHLNNLEKLTLRPTSFPFYRDISAEYIDHLLGLRNLTKLRLEELDREHIHGILPSLGWLTQLKTLELIMYEGDENFALNAQAITDLVQRLTHLEKLGFRYILLEVSTITNIIRFANQLKLLRIEDYNLQLTPYSISKIVYILKRNRPENAEPMALCVDDDSIASSLNEKVRKYLQVNRNN